MSYCCFFITSLHNFNLIHVIHIADHKVEYTLYRICLRFFWSQMCSDDTEWIKQYSNFMLTYRWRRRGRELAFSWPISSIFTIIHVELWMPDHHTDSNSFILLIYVIYEMSQHVVVVIIPDQYSVTLMSYFI